MLLPLLHLKPPTVLVAITLAFTFTLTTSLPTIPPPDTNQTTPTLSSVLKPDHAAPAVIKADTCPTPPTEFLPYAPPSGYAPAPGCPPASQGTQPSEDDPPAGFYGGSGGGSGSGSGATTASSAEESGAVGGWGEGVGWRGSLWWVGFGIGCAVGWIG